MSVGLRSVQGTRVRRAGATPEHDHETEAAEGARDEVVVEEPLEIRISGDTLAVTMRTPGSDRELVLGFLWAEGIISSVDDVAAIAHCGRPGTEGFGNTIEVTPAAGARLRLPEESAVRRGTLVSSACGVCGRTSIDDLLARCAPVGAGGRMGAGAVARAAAALRGRQPLFARSGGCHAASLVTREGEHLATFEDVGRHNAVDKVIGWALRERRLPLRGTILLVSGRASFELAQKALMAGVPMLCAVSAPSSLAVDLAVESGMTLIGFLRDPTMVIYSGAARVGAGEPA